MEGFKGAYMKQEEDTSDIKADMLRQYKTMQVHDPDTLSLDCLNEPIEPVFLLHAQNLRSIWKYALGVRTFFAWVTCILLVFSSFVYLYT